MTSFADELDAHAEMAWPDPAIRERDRRLARFREQYGAPAAAAPTDLADNPEKYGYRWQDGAFDGAWQAPAEASAERPTPFTDARDAERKAQHTQALAKAHDRDYLGTKSTPYVDPDTGAAGFGVEDRGVRGLVGPIPREQAPGVVERAANWLAKGSDEQAARDAAEKRARMGQVDALGERISRPSATAGEIAAGVGKGLSSAALEAGSYPFTVGLDAIKSVPVLGKPISDTAAKLLNIPFAVAKISGAEVIKRYPERFDPRTSEGRRNLDLIGIGEDAVGLLLAHFAVKAIKGGASALTGEGLAPEGPPAFVPTPGLSPEPNVSGRTPYTPPIRPPSPPPEISPEIANAPQAPPAPVAPPSPFEYLPATGDVPQPPKLQPGQPLPEGTAPGPQPFGPEMPKYGNTAFEPYVPPTPPVDNRSPFTGHVASDLPPRAAPPAERPSLAPIEEAARRETVAEAQRAQAQVNPPPDRQGQYATAYDEADQQKLNEAAQHLAPDELDLRNPPTVKPPGQEALDARTALEQAKAQIQQQAGPKAPEGFDGEIAAEQTKAAAAPSPRPPPVAPPVTAWAEADLPEFLKPPPESAAPSPFSPTEPVAPPPPPSPRVASAPEPVTAERPLPPMPSKAAAGQRGAVSPGALQSMGGAVAGAGIGGAVGGVPGAVVGGVAGALAPHFPALSEYYRTKFANPLISALGIGAEKYPSVRIADPQMADAFAQLDNAVGHLGDKADFHVKNITEGLTRTQEHLAALLADADSRAHLQREHPTEYAAAVADPQIQAALAKYRPIADEITTARRRLGGKVLEGDYLARVYERATPGIGKAEVPEPEIGYDPVTRKFGPQKFNKASREKDAAWFQEHGLHEFGPAVGTKYVATMLKAVRADVGDLFRSQATELPAGTLPPRSIDYRGETYWSPTVASKGMKTYGKYVDSEGRALLGPREIVDQLRKHEVDDLLKPEGGNVGPVLQYFRNQMMGFGGGLIHDQNLIRRAATYAPMGVLDPRGWANATVAAMSKELKARAMRGFNDPTVDALSKFGVISTRDMEPFRAYWVGNFKNPLAWLANVALAPVNAMGKLADIGKKNVFGRGGLQQRDAIFIHDLVKSQRPELSEAQIAQEVRTVTGDYNRANWTDRMKSAGQYMTFPGWDFSSARWVIQHPLRTTVPPAALILVANRVIHAFGGNRDEDKNDFMNVHVGDRAYGSSLLTEPIAKNLFRPAYNYIQSKLNGETGQRPIEAASEGLKNMALAPVGMFRPEAAALIGLATGTDRGRDIVPKQDREMPGRFTPSKALEDRAAFVGRKAMPAVDRLMSDEGFAADIPGFLGSTFGVPNQKVDAAKRLFRNDAEAERVMDAHTVLAKTDHAKAAAYRADPDNAAFLALHEDLQGTVKALHETELAEAKARVMPEGAEKVARLSTLATTRARILATAEKVNERLHAERLKNRAKAANPFAVR